MFLLEKSKSPKSLRFLGSEDIYDSRLETLLKYAKEDDMEREASSRKMHQCKHSGPEEDGDSYCLWTGILRSGRALRDRERAVAFLKDRLHHARMAAAGGTAGGDLLEIIKMS